MKRTTRAGIAVALALGLGLTASAAAAPLVTAPAGWKGGANIELVQVTGSAPHFGGVHGIIEAEQYTPKPGIVLDVARISATTSAPAVAARAELDALQGAAERSDDATRQLEATVAASDNTGPGVHQQTRLVIVATKDKIVAVQGDCIAGVPLDQAAFDACTAALATLDPGVDVKDRIAIAVAPRGGASNPPAASDPSAGPPPPRGNASYMSDGSRLPMPPMVVRPDAPEPITDKRPFFVGAGVVLLAAMFWWNRRRRERFEAEDKEDPHD